MKINVGILGTGSYLPEKILSNKEIAQEKLGYDSEKAERFNRAVRKLGTGVTQRRIADASEDTSDLAVKAASKALDRAGLEPQEINYLLLASDTPDVHVPGTFPYVLEKLGITNATGTDVSGACAGFIKALELARDRIIARGVTEKILVIGVELITRQIDWKEDKKAAVLFGDGASAVVVGSRQNTPQILATYNRTDGSKANLLCKPHGGTREPNGRINALIFKGEKVFKEAIKRMPEAVRAVVGETGRGIDEIDWLIPHQANLAIIKEVAKNLKIPEQKVLINIQDYANTGAASVGIVLDQSLRKSKIKNGDLVALTAFGAGFCWGGALLQF